MNLKGMRTKEAFLGVQTVWVYVYEVQNKQSLYTVTEGWWEGTQNHLEMCDILYLDLSYDGCTF
jgi:hypothetical protein